LVLQRDLVAEGPEKSSLTYLFKEPGEYLLTYIETEKKEGKTATVAHARAHTRVAPLSGVQTEVACNVEMQFAPPPGYQKQVWTIDGKEVSMEPILKRAFQVPGTYRVECLTSAPSQGPAQAFLRIRYNTIVK
jgi:hypothetical protein